MKRINEKRESSNGEMGVVSGTGLGDDMDSLLESIQMLIPLGLKAVGEATQSEAARLAGGAYSRGTGPV